ncbi:MAG TPA: ribonuclease Z [Bacteroidia bacterium]|nr:ribonuclease Z [Bacteroidia bacterium]
MDAFSITILGSSSATPAFGRNPSSQVVQHSGNYFLVDCGEAAQIQLRRFSLKFQRINHIFISHLHGDHFLGLPGLLSSMHLLGRTEPLHVYAEEGLQEIIEITHTKSRSVLQYPLIFHSLDFKESKVIYENDKISVRTLIMKHSVPCCGFLFEEKPQPRKLIKEELEKHNIPIALLEGIKQGKDFIEADGSVVSNESITMPPLPSRKYACCADTIYKEDIIPFIHNADLLYHEATFTEDMKDRAKQTMHCTAKDAATIASKAEVGKLIVSHFSARYKDLNPLLEEARSVFPNTWLAEEGLKVNIEFRNTVIA